MKKKELKAKIAELEEECRTATLDKGAYIKTVEYLRIQMEKSLTVLPEVTRHILKEALEETRPKGFMEMMETTLSSTFGGPPAAASEKACKDAGVSEKVARGGTLCR